MVSRSNGKLRCEIAAYFSRSSGAAPCFSVIYEEKVRQGRQEKCSDRVITITVDIFAKGNEDKVEFGIAENGR